MLIFYFLIWSAVICERNGQETSLPEYVVSECYGDTFNFDCGSDNMIRINQDFFGYSNGESCEYHRGDCTISNPKSNSLIHRYCTGKRWCTYYMVERRACDGYFTNYQQVEYQCIPETKVVDICEEKEFEAYSTYIASPNFPNLYPPNLDCSCIVSPKNPDVRVHMEIVFLAIKYNKPCQDWLKIGRRRTCGTTVDLYSGKAIPIEFHSDHEGSHSGFWLHFQASKYREPLVVKCGKNVTSNMADIKRRPVTTTVHPRPASGQRVPAAVPKTTLKPPPPPPKAPQRYKPGKELLDRLRAQILRARQEEEKQKKNAVTTQVVSEVRGIIQPTMQPSKSISTQSKGTILSPDSPTRHQHTTEKKQSNFQEQFKDSNLHSIEESSLETFDNGYRNSRNNAQRNGPNDGPYNRFRNGPNNGPNNGPTRSTVDGLTDFGDQIAEPMPYGAKKNANEEKMAYEINPTADFTGLHSRHNFDVSESAIKNQNGRSYQLNNANNPILTESPRRRTDPLNKKYDSGLVQGDDVMTKDFIDMKNKEQIQEAEKLQENLESFDKVPNIVEETVVEETRFGAPVLVSEDDRKHQGDPDSSKNTFSSNSDTSRNTQIHNKKEEFNEKNREEIYRHEQISSKELLPMSKIRPSSSSSPYEGFYELGRINSELPIADDLALPKYVDLENIGENDELEDYYKEYLGIGLDKNLKYDYSEYYYYPENIGGNFSKATAVAEAAKPERKASFTLGLIVLGACAALVLCLVIFIVFLVYCRRRKLGRKEPRLSTPDSSPASSELSSAHSGDNDSGQGLLVAVTKPKKPSSPLAPKAHSSDACSTLPSYAKGSGHQSYVDVDSLYAKPVKSGRQSSGASDAYEDVVIRKSPLRSDSEGSLYCTPTPLALDRLPTLKKSITAPDMICAGRRGLARRRRKGSKSLQKSLERYRGRAAAARVSLGHDSESDNSMRRIRQKRTVTRNNNNSKQHHRILSDSEPDLHSSSEHEGDLLRQRSIASMSELAEVTFVQDIENAAYSDVEISVSEPSDDTDWETRSAISI